MTGETGSVDFPTTPGAFDTTTNGAFDAFVTKLNPSGSGLVYSTLLGGAAVDFGVRIALARDGSNSAFVLGETSSTNFPTTPGAFDTTGNGSFDVFVTKLNPAGSALQYSTLLGGTNMDVAGGLAIDASGDAFVVGGTLSTNFPTTPGAFKTISDGNDAFVTKLNPTGSALLYSTVLGGSASDGASAVAVDAAGNAFVAGSTSSVDFPTTPDAVRPHFNGGPSDAFVTELNAAGSAITYSTLLGGTSSDNAFDLKLDPRGAIYVVGQTLSADFPTTPGALDRAFQGNPTIFWDDAFVTKLTVGSAPPAPAALSSVTVSPRRVDRPPDHRRV